MNFFFRPQRSLPDAHTHSRQSFEIPASERHSPRRGLGAAISAAASPASTQSFSETEPETPEQGLA